MTELLAMSTHVLYIDINKNQISLIEYKKFQAYKILTKCLQLLLSQ